MIAVNIYGAPAWLLPYGPNTDDGVSLKAHVELDAQRGETGRGSRRPQAYLLRHEFGFITRMAAEDYFAARAASLMAEDQPIAVPFWLAARLTSEAAAMTSGLTVAWTEDWATYEINPVSLAAYDYHAPLLLGVFKQPPRLQSRSSDNVTAEVVIIEQGDADAALIPPASADITLATPDGYLAAVFPFTPEAGTAPKLTLAQVTVERQQLGPGRTPSDIYYPQPRETVAQPAYKFASSAELIELLGWWLRRGGGADCFWVATTQKIGDLTGDLPSGSTTVPTVAAMTVSVGDTLALCTTGLEPEFVRVDSIVAGVPQLAAPTAVDHPKAWTTVVPALLATHTDTELALNLARASEDWIGAATLAFREVASEYAATDGETRGTTLGRLPAWAWLAEIALDYSGATQTWRITSWESGATTPDPLDWEYRDHSFNQLTRSIDLEDDAAQVKIRWWDGCPWENWLPGKLAATGTFTIYRSPVAADGTVGAKELVWAGRLGSPQREGPILTVKVLGANALFSTRAPHAQMTPDCWKRLYGAKCRLDIADWKFNATISAIAGQSVTVDTISRANGGGLPAGFGSASWFWLGYVEWVDADGHPLRAEVLASTAIVGGAITLTLGRTLGFAVGAAVVLVPGCDKTYSTCSGRFGNGGNDGGWPDMPAVDPSFKIPNSTSTPAKK